MLKRKYNISYCIHIFLIITALFCVSLDRGIQPSAIGKVSLDPSCVDKEDHGSNSNEILLQNVAIEAVMPFIHADLSPNLFFSSFIFSLQAIELHVAPCASAHVRKYFKTLFLFIISSNAP